MSPIRSSVLVRRCTSIPFQNSLYHSARRSSPRTLLSYSALSKISISPCCGPPFPIHSSLKLNLKKNSFTMARSSSAQSTGNRRDEVGPNRRTILIILSISTAVIFC